MATKKKAAKSKKTKAKSKPKAKKTTKKKAKPATKKAAKKKPAKKAQKAKPKKKPATKKKAAPKKKPVPKKKPAPKKKISSKKKVAKGTKKSATSKKKAPPVKAKPRPPVELPVDVNFDLASRIQRQKNVAWRMIDGEAVIVTPADSTMHTLNDVGTRIWELMTGSRSLKEVAGILCTEFEVDRERAEKDTIWFAECLAKKGLVEVR